MADYILTIPFYAWYPIDDEAKGGQLVWLLDEEGHIDLGRWDAGDGYSRGDWKMEWGAVSEPISYADVSLDRT